MQEDLENDITDFKDKNKNLNKEKFKEIVKDMNEKNYELLLGENENENEYKIEI